MRFLKLTHVRGASTLINMDAVQTAYRVSDPSGRYEPSTKIQFNNGEFVNVTEDLQTILKLTQEFQAGEYQSVDWQDVPSVQNRLEASYGTRKPRERSYNNESAFNDTRW
jgi:hypothetical protein